MFEPGKAQKLTRVGPRSPWSRAIATTSLAIWACLTQSGCNAILYDSYFHPTEHRWGLGGVRASFDFEVEGCRFGGDLTASKTIICTFLPGITLLVLDHNPYHLQLWQNCSEQVVRVTRVVLADTREKILFSSEGREGVFAEELKAERRVMPVRENTPEPHEWQAVQCQRDGIPIFACNPK